VSYDVGAAVCHLQFTSITASSWFIAFGFIEREKRVWGWIKQSRRVKDGFVENLQFYQAICHIRAQAYRFR
jgi:hypothetical protein